MNLSAIGRIVSPHGEQGTKAPHPPAHNGVEEELALIRELVSLQRRYANNLNQVAILANNYGGGYPDEIKNLQKDYMDLWERLSELLKKRHS